MPSWRDSIPSKWLKAKDLDGKPHLVTIKRFSVEKIGDTDGPVVRFAEFDKSFGLNITNGQTIENITGSPDPKNWIGKRVVIYPTETDYAGSRVACIRVRAPKPGAKLPPAPEPSPDLDPPDEGGDFHASDEDVPF